MVALVELRESAGQRLVEPGETFEVPPDRAIGYVMLGMADLADVPPPWWGSAPANAADLPREWVGHVRPSAGR